MSDSLTGRRLLVTGASSGVGAATAALLAAAGGRIGLLARDRVRLDAVAERTPGAIVAAADVCDPIQVGRAVDAVVGEFGGLDAVVNAAGVNRAAPFRDIGAADLTAMVGTNLLGPMYVCHAALPHLLASETADIVNISSMSARRVLSVDAGAYAATKAALSVWSAAIAEELGAAGIRVMTLSPGMIDTEFAANTLDPDVRRKRQAQSAASGLAAQDVAEQIMTILTLPRELRLHEVALMSSRQRR